MSPLQSERFSNLTNLIFYDKSIVEEPKQLNIMAKKVAYSRKTVTTILPKIPKELEDQISYAGMLASLIWNLAFDQCEYWLSLPKNDPAKKPLTPFSLNYWLTEVKCVEVVTPSGERLQTGLLASSLRREVCRMLAGAWQSYFSLLKKGDNKARAPRKKEGEGSFQAMAWSNPKISRVSGRAYFVLPVMKGLKLEIPLDRHLSQNLNGKDVKEVKISRVRRGQDDSLRYKISVVYAYHPPKPTGTPTRMRAIDLGAGDLAVCDSTGESYLIPMRRPDKYWMRRIGEVENRLETCKKGSRSWQRRMRARRRMHNKSGDQKNDFQRKLARDLIARPVHDEQGRLVGFEKTCDIIVIGESKVRLGLAKSESGVAKQHYGVQNTGYLDRLLRFIEEKAEEHGVLVIKKPDPRRSGKLSDKTQKLGAAAMLLRGAGQEYGVPVHDGPFALKKHL